MYFTRFVFLSAATKDLTESFNVYYGDTLYYELPVRTPIERLEVLSRPRGLTVNDGGMVTYKPPESDGRTEESAAFEVVTCGQTFVYQLRFTLGKCPCLHGGVCSKEQHSTSQCRCPEGYVGEICPS